MKQIMLVVIYSVVLLAILLMFVFVDDIYDHFKATSGLNYVSEEIDLDYPEPTIIEGFDWRLPVNTLEESYSGLIDEGGSFGGRFIIIRWDETNPIFGKFDFSKFNKQLEEIAPLKVLVRLEVNSACEAPEWALKRLKYTKAKSLIFWDKSYLKLLKPYINEFGRRFANNSQIIGVQLGIADGEYKGDCANFDNKDGWGEFWMSPKELVEAENDFGFTPDVFIKQTKQIIDLYADAFKGNEGKLAFTNIDPFFSWDEISRKYDKKMREIAEYVFKKGLGNRDGEIEVWMRYLSESYGVSLEKLHDGTCSIEMDENYARKTIGRYMGTENEFYGNEGYILDYGGPLKNQAYRFIISSLRALQMRRNFMSINSEGMKNLKDSVFQIQNFLEYLKKTMGKQIENTPDIFILLGERYIRAESVIGVTQSGEACVREDKLAVRSFGRWLKEKSNSIPAVKVKMPEDEKFWVQGMYLPEGYDFEYSARSGTDFKFDVNNDLVKKRCKNKCNVEIKVTFKDDTKTHVWLEVAEGITKYFNSQGDGKIKTITFSVESNFNNVQGEDFILATDGHPISIILVRVNFL